MSHPWACLTSMGAWVVFKCLQFAWPSRQPAGNCQRLAGETGHWCGYILWHDGPENSLNWGHLAIFINQACTGLCVPGFLKLLWFMRQYVYVCVCPPPRPLIISGMIWCDIDCVIGYTSFTAFSCSQLLYMTLVVDKMDGHGLITTARRVCLLRWCGISYRRTTRKTERFSNKG